MPMEALEVTLNESAAPVAARSRKWAVAATAAGVLACGGVGFIAGRAAVSWRSHSGSQSLRGNKDDGIKSRWEMDAEIEKEMAEKARKAAARAAKRAQEAGKDALEAAKKEADQMSIYDRWAMDSEHGQLDSEPELAKRQDATIFEKDDEEEEGMGERQPATIFEDAESLGVPAFSGGSFDDDEDEDKEEGMGERTDRFRKLPVPGNFEDINGLGEPAVSGGSFDDEDEDKEEFEGHLAKRWAADGTDWTKHGQLDGIDAQPAVSSGSFEDEDEDKEEEGMGKRQNAFEVEDDAAPALKRTDRFQKLPVPPRTGH